jgi:hypothetical protein
MLNKNDIQDILDKISYKNWNIRLGENNGYYFLQCIFMAPDNYTGELSEQRCRKWQLSCYMTPSEVVRTAYKAVLAAQEHEVGEHFRYKNELIYCPHFDVEALVEISRDKRLDIRDEEGYLNKT